jgi:hypothetical protein
MENGSTLGPEEIVCSWETEFVWRVSDAGVVSHFKCSANENIGTIEEFTSWLKRAWSPLKVICPDLPRWKLFSLELDRSYPQPAMICRSSHVPKTCELLRAPAHLVLSLSQVHVAAVEDFADDAAKFMDCFYKVHVSLWAPISERVCACTGLSLGLPLYLCFLFRFVACGQAFSGLAISFYNRIQSVYLKPESFAVVICYVQADQTFHNRTCFAVFGLFEISSAVDR